MRGRRIKVELLFSKKAAAWVKDKSWHPSQETKLLKDSRLKMTLKVADNDELVGWILSFGGEVRVMAPGPLRQTGKTTNRVDFDCAGFLLARRTVCRRARAGVFQQASRKTRRMPGAAGANLVARTGRS